MNVIQVNKLTDRITSGRFGEVKYSTAVEVARAIGYEGASDGKIAKELEVYNDLSE